MLPNQTFEVPPHLRYLRGLGSGATGTVAAFLDTETNTQVAVKKVSEVFRDFVDAKRVSREVKILRQLHHDNIIKVLDVLPPPSPDIRDLYIISELMETDLHRVIYSKQTLTEQHLQYFAYQLLRGLCYLHSLGIVHRDLKPSNVLLNLNCDLKICDFGLARGIQRHSLEGIMHEDQTLTDYVVTRWYRAPEIILGCHRYDFSVDLWSTGCVLAEILGRKVLFAGKDHLNQLEQILSVMGTPTSEDLRWLPRNGPSANARRFLDSLPYRKPLPLHVLFPEAASDCVDLLGRLLAVNPEKRISAVEALRHPYFKDLHSPEDETFGQKELNWDFDHIGLTKSDLQYTLYEEAVINHPEIILRDFPILYQKNFHFSNEGMARLRENIRQLPDITRNMLEDKVHFLELEAPLSDIPIKLVEPETPSDDDHQSTSQSTTSSSVKGISHKRKREVVPESNRRKQRSNTVGREERGGRDRPLRSQRRVASTGVSRR